MNTQDVIHQKALELFKKLQGYPENTALTIVDPIFRCQTALNRDRWYDLAAEVLDTEIAVITAVSEQAAKSALNEDWHGLETWLQKQVNCRRPVTDADVKAQPISPAAVENEPAPPPEPGQFPSPPERPDAFPQ